MSHSTPLGISTQFKGVTHEPERVIHRGRKWTTISSPENFRTHVLNVYKINYQRVRGTSWYLIQWPQSEVASTRLSNYQYDSLSSLRINLSPYDTIIYIGVREKPVKGDVIELLQRTIVVGRTSTHYSRNMLPLWWSNACTILRRYNIPYTTLERAVTTETQLLIRNGVAQQDIDTRYDPHTLNKELIESYRLISVPTSTIPPYLHLRHSIRVADKTLIVLRDSTSTVTVATTTSTMKIFYANMRLIEWVVLNNQGLFGEHEEILFRSMLQAHNLSQLLNYATPRECLGEVKLNCLDVSAWNDSRFRTPLQVLQESLEDLQAIHDAQESLSGINEQNDNTFLTEEE